MNELRKLTRDIIAGLKIYTETLLKFIGRIVERGGNGKETRHKGGK